MKTSRKPLAGVLVVFLLHFISNTRGYAQEYPVVRAILFFSPTWSHCHKVIMDYLTPLLAEFPNQLEIIGVDVSQNDGQQLFQQAVKHFNIPESRIGVPMLIVGETILVGSYEIPQMFTEIVVDGVSTGGIDWPNFPDLLEHLRAVQATQTAANIPPTSQPNAIATPTAQLSQTAKETNDQIKTPKPTGPAAKPKILGLEEAPSLSQAKFLIRFSQDIVGNSMAMILLLIMIFSLAWNYRNVTRKIECRSWPTWAIPVLATIGVAISSYLAYIETSHSTAVCGPIGDCNTVQTSPYARLFGIIPMGAIGILGCFMIISLWLLRRHRPADTLKTLWLLSFSGTVFSVYLTFLEPFVIGATCLWCLSSALLMTLMLWAFTPLVNNRDLITRTPK